METIKVSGSASTMRKGILEFATLLAIGKEETYSSDILETLKRENLLVVEGTLYPLLSRLRENGLLEYAWQESRSGPPRKYYRLTAAGTRAVSEMEDAWAALSKSVNSLHRNYEKGN